MPQAKYAICFYNVSCILPISSCRPCVAQPADMPQLYRPSMVAMAMLVLLEPVK
jgi:hypothetical protein